MPEDLPLVQQCIYRQIQAGDKSQGELYDSCCPSYPNLNLHLKDLTDKNLIEPYFATAETGLSVLTYRVKRKEISWFQPQ